MKIRAAVSRKGEAFPVIEELELAPPGPDEIFVRIVACGICRTDLEVHAGRARTPKPIVLGHEGAGIVEAVGANVSSPKRGDHVVLTASACGQCRNCLHDRPSYCDDTMKRNFGGLRPDGTTALTENGKRVFGHFFGQSSFAEYVVAGSRSAIVVPTDLPLEHLAPLGCGVLTGAGAVFHAFEADACDTLAVFGVGAVGLSAVMAARLLGLSRIIAVDTNTTRLALATELGATDAIASGSMDDVAGAVLDTCRRGVDFCLNTTQSAPLFAASIACLAVGGVAGFVAAPHEPSPIEPRSLLSGGKSARAILGSGGSPSALAQKLVVSYRAGEFPLDRLISVYPFTELARAFQDLDDGKAIKPVLQMT